MSKLNEIIKKLQQHSIELETPIASFDGSSQMPVLTEEMEKDFEEFLDLFDGTNQEHINQINEKFDALEKEENIADAGQPFMSLNEEENEAIESFKQKALSAGYTWVNDIKNQKIKPKVVFYPESREELISCVQIVINKEERVRCVGSGHSFSDIAISADNLVIPFKLNRILEEEAAFHFVGNGELIHLDRFDINNYVEVEAGIKIKRMNRELDKRNKAIATMGGYDGQTLAGVIATATHGSRHDMGPIPAMVASFTMITEEGALMRIEPSDGMTNATKFKEKYDEEISLIQDDNTFNAVLVSMGCMGIFYSVTLKVEPLYYLQEDRFLSTWKEQKDLIKANGLAHLQKDNAIDYNLMINPYFKNGDTHHKCLVTRRARTNESNRPHGKAGMRSFAKWLYWLMKIVGDIGKGSLRHAKNKNRIAKQLNFALNALRDNVSGKRKGYIDKSYLVYITSNANVKGFALELAFPMEGEYTKYVDKVLEIIDSYVVDKRFFTSPIGVRFMDKSDCYLAPQYGQRTMTIEIPMVSFTPKENAIKIEILQDLHQAMKAAFPELRPHWGLHFDEVDKNYGIKNLYEKYDDWRVAYQKFNSKGVFSNDFTERMGFDSFAEPEDLEA